MQTLKSFLHSVVDDEHLLKSIIEGYEAIFEASTGTLFWGTSQTAYDAVTKKRGALSSGSGVQMTTDKALATQYAQSQSTKDHGAPIVVSYNIPQLNQTATVMYYKPKIYAVSGKLSGQIGNPYSAGNHPYISSGPLKFSPIKPTEPRTGPITADKLLNFNVGKEHTDRRDAQGMVANGAEMLGGVLELGSDIRNLFRRKK